MSLVGGRMSLVRPNLGKRSPTSYQPSPVHQKHMRSIPNCIKLVQSSKIVIWWRQELQLS
jgi:hypothetical protein